MARLLPHRHTGRLVPHRRSSYRGLSFVLAIMGVVLLSLGPSAYGETGEHVTNPQSGVISLTGTVPGPPPSTKATIITPQNGTTITTLPVNVTGTCKAGLIVSIYANETFIGSTTCTNSGAFSLQVNLFLGTNTLVAKVMDALGQSGPDSDSVTVTYNAPSLSLATGVAVANQLFLTSSTVERGGEPGTAVSWPITIVGGVAPYALSIDWGDGKTELVSRGFNGAVVLSHTYDHPGAYQVTFKASDATGNSALLEVVTVINGPVAAAAPTKIDPSILLSVWPLYVLACLMVLIFFLGERRELHKLRKRHLVLQPN